jgi:hypothetical protein
LLSAQVMDLLTVRKSFWQVARWSDGDPGCGQTHPPGRDIAFSRRAAGSHHHGHERWFCRIKD